MNLRPDLSEDKVTVHIFLSRTMNNLIHIKLEFLSLSIFVNAPLDLESKFINVNRKHSIKPGGQQEILEESFYYTDPKLKEFARSKITLNYENPYFTYSLTFQLSTFPQTALNWLGCFSEFLHRNSKNYTEILIHADNHVKIIAMDNERHHSMYMAKYVYFLDSILSLRCANPLAKDPYLHVFDVLSKIITAYQTEMTKPRYFVNYIEIEKRFKILYSDIFNIFFNKNNKLDVKLNALIEISREFINNNQQAELNFLLQSLNHIVRKQLLMNNKFSEVERDFFQYAECCLDKGKLKIINIESNPGYQRHFSYGKKFYRFYVMRIKEFAKQLGLGFKHHANLRVEIVFDEISTKKLMDMGLHITLPYIKRYLYLENTMSILTHQSDTRFNIMQTLPIDALCNILSHVEIIPKKIYQDYPDKQLLLFPVVNEENDIVESALEYTNHLTPGM